MQYPSKTIEAAVEELSRLPGIGRKTALRLALHLLREPETAAENLGSAIVSLRRNTRYCTSCGNISDSDTCAICADLRRDASLLCVVEDCKDVIAIENTNQFKGRYHVLGGLIDPLHGIGPSHLNLDSLFVRLDDGDCRELIFAFSATIEGDTTAFFISRKIENKSIRISNIARGIPVGSDLEFTDEVTLARSFLNRVEFMTEKEGAG